MAEMVTRHAKGSGAAVYQGCVFDSRWGKKKKLSVKNLNLTFICKILNAAQDKTGTSEQWLNNIRYRRKSVIVLISGTSSAKSLLTGYIIILTSVDTAMCCPKGKCGCQYFISLTLNKKYMDTGVLDFF